MESSMKHEKIKKKNTKSSLDHNNFETAESKLSRQIIAQTRKIAAINIQHLAIDVLLEATVIARWHKKPFYVS